MEQLIGRTEEKETLERALETTESELVAIYGRRRVGKTFLIKSVYRDRTVFEFSGTPNANLDAQLASFTEALQRTSRSPLPLATPSNWQAAFSLLRNILMERLGKTKKKSVVFFDEFPWIHTPKSNFLQAFSYFWNSWAAWDGRLVVVICGSAASWMIRKVLNDRGGLHNRVTKRIRLFPFTLTETADYLKSRRIVLDAYQVLQLYCCMGGIPHYLKTIEPGMSVSQAIDRACFTQQGALRDEFQALYQSLFEHADNHILIIRTLARKAIGMTRTELLSEAGLRSGGGATTILTELEASGFITTYIPFGKTAKNSLIKLTDEYSLFYLRFIEHSRATGEGTWLKRAQGPVWKSWSGYAFEGICMKHSTQLKRALGIADVYTEISPWRYQGTAHEAGCQIDLLFDRQDGCINVCEIKFYPGPFSIDKAYAEQLQKKLTVFRQQTKTRKTLFLTFITPFGLKKNSHSINLVQKETTMDAFF